MLSVRLDNFFHFLNFLQDCLEKSPPLGSKESAAAELARLRGVMQRFPPREGTWLHLKALEGRCVGHSFTVDAAGRLFIKTQVPLCCSIER
jgi:hypothetical protein